MVAAPAPPRHPGLLRRPADHGQGVRRPPLHDDQTPRAGAGPEDPRPVLPVPALRGEPGCGPLGLLPRQGGQVCLSVPAAGTPVVSPSARADRPGPRPGAPDQGAGHAIADEAAGTELDEPAPEEPGRRGVASVAICRRATDDRTGSCGSAIWGIFTKVRWRIPTKVLRRCA